MLYYLYQELSQTFYSPEITNTQQMEWKSVLSIVNVQWYGIRTNSPSKTTRKYKINTK